MTETSESERRDRAGSAPLMVAFGVLNVLIEHRPDRWRRHLAQAGALNEAQVEQSWRECGLEQAWETGALTLEQLAARLGELLRAPELGVQTVEDAFRAPIGPLDPILGQLAAQLAARGQLIWVSDGGPGQWELAEQLLTGAGIVAGTPAALSHRIGVRTPTPAFFDVLMSLAHGHEVLFIHKDATAVRTAAARGLKGLRHTDAASTAAIITGLIDLEEQA